MSLRGTIFEGRSDGHHDAVRISPRSPYFVQVRSHSTGQWFDSCCTGNKKIVTLEWDQNIGWVDAIFADGTRKHAEILRPK